MSAAVGGTVRAWSVAWRHLPWRAAGTDRRCRDTLSGHLTRDFFERRGRDLNPRTQLPRSTH